MKKLYTFLVSSMVMLLLSSSSFAKIVYVKQASDGGFDAIGTPGTSWATACATIQYAINNKAVSGDEIWVAKGVYYPTLRPSGTGSLPSGQTIFLKSGVSIYGSLADGATTLEGRDFIANMTTITQDNNELHIVVGAADLGDFTMDGFKISGGSATGGTAVGNYGGSGETVLRVAGAGMYLANVGNNVKLKNLIFDSNISENSGAGLYVGSANDLAINGVSIENVVFSNNTTTGIGGDGGAISFYKIKDVTMKNVTFSGNATTLAKGGAIYFNVGNIANVNINLSKCKFINNTAGIFGGAIAINAVLTSPAPASISEPFVSRFDNCIFANNEAIDMGGAFYITGNAQTYSYNNTFYNNKATNAVATDENGVGGVFAIDDDVTYGDLTRLYVYNSIMYGNTTANTATTTTNDFYFDPARLEIATTQVEINNNITQNYSGGTANKLAVDPLFLSTTSTDADFLKISDSSPAINAGNNMYVLAGNTTDYAGEDRVQLVTVDMGAYESAVSTLPVNLLSFTATKAINGAQLKWSTVSEQSNSFFTVERSTDGKNFSLLNTVTGAGNSSSRSNYALSDNQPATGVNYYRLSQTDLNGVSKILDTKSLSFDLTASKVSFYPNPASDYVTMNLGGNNFSSGKIVDLSGKTQKVFDINGNTAKVAVSDLTNGVYLIALTGENSSETLRIIKK